MIESLTTLPRVSYCEGQVLSTADLRDEQQYLTASWRRHAISSHLWGVSQGLKLEIEGTTLTVRPGIAIDGLGRVLVVSEPLSISIANLNISDVSVLLLFSQVSPSETSDRDLETSRIRLVPYAAVHLGRTSDNSSSDECPVYLGRLQRNTSDNAFSVTREYRPMVSLAGAAVWSASGAALMQCGEKFSVSAVDAGNQSCNDQLLVSGDGKLKINGDAHFSANLIVRSDDQAAGQLTSGLGFEVSVPEPACERPWQIYLSKGPLTAGTSSNEKLRDSLVFELPGAHDKEDPASLRAAIGSTPQQDFEPIIIVESDGNVTVSGVLRVEGQLIESPITADMSDPRFVVALTLGATGTLTRPQAHSFSVQMEAGRSKAHTKLDYNLILKNGGAQPVRILQAQIFATLDGQLAHQTTVTLPAAASDLVPGAQHRVPGTLAFSSEGKVALGVGVLGMCHSGPISAKDTIEVQVT